MITLEDRDTKWTDWRSWVLKEFDLMDRVPKELWTVVCDIVQEAVIKTIPKEKKCKRQNGN